MKGVHLRYTLIIYFVLYIVPFLSFDTTNRNDSKKNRF